MTFIYIYTIRRSVLDKEVQYIDLIPKLFDIFYNQDDKTYINEYISNLYKKYCFIFSKNIDQQKKFFRYLLNDDNNLINETSRDNYIDNHDICKLIKINLDYYNEIKNKNKYDKFIEHLYRAHDTKMKYGLYFSIKYANDDKDFYDNINKNNVNSFNKRIIYYTKLDNLLDHLDNIYKEYNFSDTTKLLYLNNRWQYGNITESSIILNKSIQLGINKDKFIQDIKKNYQEITDIEELICQIPLPIELFKFTFIENNHEVFYKKKYLKYKNKYLQLKSLK